MTVGQLVCMARRGPDVTVFVRRSQEPAAVRLCGDSGPWAVSVAPRGQGMLATFDSVMVGLWAEWMPSDERIPVEFV